MCVSREALQQAIGEIVLFAVEDQTNLDLTVKLAKNKALQALQKIQDILDNTDLSDKECVEGIAVVLQHAGISTRRHDPE